MDIDESAVIPGHKTCSQDAHETRKCHKVGIKRIDCQCQRGIETFAIGMVAMIDDNSRNAVCFGDPESFRIRAIADHRRDAAGQSGIQHGLQIAAATGDQDDQFFHRELLKVNQAT
jgi:hypothetical protein